MEAKEYSDDHNNTGKPFLHSFTQHIPWRMSTVRMHAMSLLFVFEARNMNVTCTYHRTQTHTKSALASHPHTHNHFDTTKPSVR